MDMYYSKMMGRDKLRDYQWITRSTTAERELHRSLLRDIIHIAPGHHTLAEYRATRKFGKRLALGACAGAAIPVIASMYVAGGIQKGLELMTEEPLWPAAMAVVSIPAAAFFGAGIPIAIGALRVEKYIPNIQDAFRNTPEETWPLHPHAADLLKESNTYRNFAKKRHGTEEEKFRDFVHYHKC